ncbi:MAG: helix-hairpin-helix domain-containing protein, partial [Bacteroidota bacterium]
MWKNFVNDYLSFTKKDRVGVMVLVMLIFIVVLLPYIWPVKKSARPSKEEIDKIKILAAQLNKRDTASQNNEDPIPDNYPAKKNYRKEKAETFYFDPNTLNAEGWKRLGIRDRTATTIQNFLAKGGKFRHAEDISKIYGLFKDDYERLLPYVQIKNEAGFEKKSREEKKEYASTEKPVYPEKRFSPAKIIEINSADTTAFIALPGIGSKLAARIINFRDKLGGFYSVQQVAETFGLPDSTFSKIKDLLQCNPAVMKQININTADANTLKQHPYIRWNLANVIVQYRVQHGNFKS